MSSTSVVEVAIALIWRAGCLLITRRRPETHLGGLWEFPGGKRLPGERPEDCAEREVLEEVGVACRPRRVRVPLEFVYPERTVRLFPVDCAYLGGGPRPIQVDEWAWVRPVDLRRYSFPPANEPLLAELLRESRLFPPREPQ